MNTHYIIFNFDKKTCSVRLNSTRTDAEIKSYTNATDIQSSGVHGEQWAIIDNGYIVMRLPMTTTVVIYEYGV